MQIILSAGDMAAAITAVLMLGGLIIRWFVVPPLKNMIRERTEPIQPNANGGKSLPDVALMLGRLSGQLDALTDRIESLESRLEDYRRG